MLESEARAYSVPETIGVNLDKKSGGALTMVSAEREPITGV